MPLPILRPLASSASRLLDRILCVLGAVLFAQGPEFIQQYRQRLEGRLDEARLQLSQFQRAATDSGLTLDQLMARAGGNSDPAMGRLGAVARESAARVAHLTAAVNSLRDASPFTRPFALLRHIDPSIAHATWSIYRPALPTTLDGLAYATVGVVVLLAFYHGAVRYPIQCAWRRRTARRERLLAKV